MSCVRLSSVLQVSFLRFGVEKSLSRSVTLKTFTSSSHLAKDSKDDDKKAPASVSELLSVIKGLKVDGVTSDTKKKIGFSAAAEFKKRKLQKIQSPKKTAIERKDESVSKRGLDVEVEDTIKEAVADVAKKFPDEKKTESELLQQLMRFKEATTAGESGREVKDVSAILSGIKVQKEGSKGEGVFSAQGDQPSSIAFDRTFGDVTGSKGRESQLDQDTPPHLRQTKRTLFDRKRLNIFQPAKADETEDVVTVQEDASIWEVEAEKVKKVFMSDSIRNGFDEMIQLTEEGKLWTYPIDNERGLEEEQKIPFHEHVFLEQHLEGFPNIPEIINFMELVLIGLGKNPFLTVQQKKEHIEWFRHYFENKLDVLKESSATS
ncbi:small ribosomal subunit protein mS31-like [Apostichopus japonicus]|uniref:small ribosomal subunit protein mS31-like n=1 Tax=Stichopus japonicus TaxID=307972 RepID=UPI003AB4FA7D